MTKNYPVQTRIAARELGVPATWLKQQALAGKIPYLKAGARFLFDLEVLRKILLERASQIQGEVQP
jgi:hypothetical protein